MLTNELKERFDRETQSHPIVIYMKGNQLFPRCGFSARAVEIMKQYGPLHTVDVLAEADVRDAIKLYSNFPTLPQVYVNGRLVGGSDIVTELNARGELAALVQNK